MSVVTIAAQKLKADVGGVPSPTREASGPDREPVRLVTTDLGNIEHIIGGGGLVQNVSERVSTALTKATDSIRGPHGGLIPSPIQHGGAGGVTRVATYDVTTLWQESKHDASEATSNLRMALARARARAAVLLKVKNER